MNLVRHILIKDGSGQGHRDSYRGWEKVLLVLLELLDQEATKRSLRNQDAGLGSHPGIPPHFVLRGTHGSISPWYPPQFGIPPEVLETLRDELVEQLYSEARIFTSTVSPSSPGSLDDEDALIFGDGNGFFESF